MDIYDESIQNTTKSTHVDIEKTAQNSKKILGRYFFRSHI